MIKVQQGRLGLGSPKNDGAAVVVITRCRHWSTSGGGERMGVRVFGYGLPDGEGDRRLVFVETVWAVERWNAQGVNRIGGRGCIVSEDPSTGAIEAASMRAQGALAGYLLEVGAVGRGSTTAEPSQDQLDAGERWIDLLRGISRGGGHTVESTLGVSDCYDIGLLGIDGVAFLTPIGQRVLELHANLDVAAHRAGVLVGKGGQS